MNRDWETERFSPPEAERGKEVAVINKASIDNTKLRVEKLPS